MSLTAIRTYNCAVNIGILASDPDAASALANAWIERSFVNPDALPLACYTTIVNSFVTIAVTTRMIEALQAQRVSIRNTIGVQSHLIADSLEPAIRQLMDLRSQAKSSLDINAALANLACLA